MDLKSELIKSIQIIIDKKLNNSKIDRTYKSVIKNVVPKGYVVLDTGGSERTVQCSIPIVELKIGQTVCVKEPMGDLKGLHICGVV